MPRRPPPTSLLLVQGPLPSRGKPKHTLPSLPRPTLLPPNLSRASGPSQIPRAAGRGRSNSVEDAMVFSVCNPSYCSTGVEHGIRFSSMESLLSSSTSSRRGSLDSTWSSNHSRPTSPSNSLPLSDGKLPGRSWARSSTPSLTFDVDELLALPKPAAISP